ncbi:DUF1997 domain-containing protein [Pleurocapsa sp. PCC 7319]|uniref:DUF1997 domain-containing protein n=1 Tax=Pleurocapsa sp. PCC 7319 TaxID=118161 RepID=UPI000369787D|nr:DUF1997 domain-containing protein [Pleurocapsa sp. PCC 7319]
MHSKLIARPQNTFLEISTPDAMQLTYIAEQQRTFVFEVSFNGRMDMYSDSDTVAEYLNAHEGWFCRCAQPMKVESLGDNGYVLTVGKYGSFGYEVEPKIGVVLNPPVGKVYQMHTIPLSDYEAPGYKVNYQASMELNEMPVDNQEIATNKFFSKKQVLPRTITQVNWKLDLAVEVEFPKFIHKLSSSLIQSTGDRVLGQIVRQISPRLTYKVQQDFHESHNLPIPPKNSRQLNKVIKSDQHAA